MSDLTHYEGCYTEHLDCALALIQRLRDERSVVVERARREGVLAGREEAIAACGDMRRQANHADRNHYDACTAAIRALLPADSGMVLAPREPTGNMTAAGMYEIASQREKHTNIKGSQAMALAVWKAMLSAHEGGRHMNELKELIARLRKGARQYPPKQPWWMYRKEMGEAADALEAMSADAERLDKANVDLAAESTKLRGLLSELVESVDGMENLDEMDGEEFQTNSKRLDAALEASRPHTDAALFVVAIDEARKGER